MIGFVIGVLSTLIVAGIARNVYMCIKSDRELKEQIEEQRFEELSRARWELHRRMGRLEERLSKLDKPCYDEGKGDEK